MSRTVTAAVAVFVLSMVVACSSKSPCQKLVDRVCSEGQADECANLRSLTAKSESESRQICREILKVLPDRSKELTGCDRLADMICSEMSLQECLDIRREAVGADQKKSDVCDRFAKMVKDTRKYNEDAAKGSREGRPKPPAAKLKVKSPVLPPVDEPPPQAGAAPEVETGAVKPATEDKQ